ncbi:hypothetical protein PISMIDRAFT_621643 [Pisolithus microcarpus 441]|uniref:Uncharacterized protein n=1 Tax=Pisolithus microcarpus 441 TaxID=765257 RepID=A0A0C9Z033_9AGAM|nr:hypothetical protein PISMIDRAFT_621643 [Pisolithus microcarpus 441]
MLRRYLTRADRWFPQGYLCSGQCPTRSSSGSESECSLALALFLLVQWAPDKDIRATRTTVLKKSLTGLSRRIFWTLDHFSLAWTVDICSENVNRAPRAPPEPCLPHAAPQSPLQCLD